MLLTRRCVFGDDQSGIDKVGNLVKGEEDGICLDGGEECEDGSGVRD